MRSWEKLVVSAAAAAGAALIALIAAIVIYRHRRRPRPSSESVTGNPPLRSQSTTRLSLQHGIFLLRRSLGSQSPVPRFRSLHRTSRQDGDFNWALHPHLAADAAAGGWSRFVFLAADDSPTRSISLLSSCVNPNSEAKGLQLAAGSSDFMQTVRIYPHGSDAKYDIIKLNLPLPGPPASITGGCDSTLFPTEAYFEITILHLQPVRRRRRQFHRRVQVIEDNQADSSRLVQEQKEEGKEPDEDKEEDEVVVVCVGLTRGGDIPSRPPGTYPGSIGFDSTGRLNLDGSNLVSESEKMQWGAVNKTIGCGFDPAKKTVFFTVDSILVHLVRCNSGVFSRPLFPAIAVNADVAAAVNLGQRPFKYGPANAQRRRAEVSFSSTPPLEQSPRVGSDYSGELFCMGKIQDSLWFPSSRKGTPQNGSRRDAWESIGEAESDLFEISLRR